MITSNDQVLSVRSQCILLNLNRSSIYYKPHPVDESELMNQIVEIHERLPQYGYRHPRSA